jgi:hypothetical protein
MAENLQKNRPWLIIGAIALIVLMLAYLFQQRKPHLFPELTDAGSIRITDASSRLEITRSRDDVWRIPAFGDVPADLVKVEDLLAAVQKAKRGADKTADPALYDSIGLGKSATQLTIVNRAGTPLADITLGAPDPVDPLLRFARMAGDAQSFLVSGLASVTTNGLAWTKAAPPKLDVSRLQQITLIEPNLQRMLLERGSDGRWSRTDVAASNEARADLLAAAMAGGLSPEALRSASSINWFNAHILLADSKDGLQLSLQAKRDGDLVWVRLNAAARQDAAATIQTEAAQINALRQMAFGVRGDAAQALVSTAAQFALGSGSSPANQ